MSSATLERSLEPSRNSFPRARRRSRRGRRRCAARGGRERRSGSGSRRARCRPPGTRAGCRRRPPPRVGRDLAVRDPAVRFSTRRLKPRVSCQSSGRSKLGPPALEVLVELPPHAVEVGRAPRAPAARRARSAPRRHCLGRARSPKEIRTRPRLRRRHQHVADRRVDARVGDVHAGPWSAARSASRRAAPLGLGARIGQPARFSARLELRFMSSTLSRSFFESFVDVAPRRLLGAADHSADVCVRQVVDEPQHDRRPLLRRAARAPPAHSAASGSAAVRGARRLLGRSADRHRPPGSRARWSSIALRCAIVSTQARRLEFARRRG